MTDVNRTLREVWAEIKEAYEKAEADISSAGNADQVIKYHRKSGAYPFLSENYPCIIKVGKWQFPSLQHAFQALKLMPEWIKDYDKIVEKILTAPLAEARELGKNYPFKESIEDRLELMFMLTLKKFEQNENLLYCLLTGTKNEPIWHIFDADREKVWSKSSEPRPPSQKGWWDGDNWDGKILYAVRHELRKKYPWDNEKFKARLDDVCRKNCPIPDEFSIEVMDSEFDGEVDMDAEVDLGVQERPNKKLPLGTLIANCYQVVRVVDTPGMGFYVGSYCYVCKDLTPRDDNMLSTIRECMESASLGEVRQDIEALVQTLVSATSWKDCGKLFDCLKERFTKVAPGRFNDQKAPTWWETLESTTSAAASICAGDASSTSCVASRLKSAHKLRQILPDPPLVVMKGEKRTEEGPHLVFVKTFNKKKWKEDPAIYGRAVIQEIRRCSVKAPDFSWSTVEASANLSAIYGGSHAGSLYHNSEDSLKTLNHRTLAFVALEHNDGLDLFDLAHNMNRDASSTEVISAVVQACCRQVLDALTHLHELSAYHGDIKPDNIILTRRGYFKLIDYGRMAMFKEYQLEHMKTDYSAPAFLSEIERQRSIGKRMQGNDLWMLGNVLLFLTLRPCGVHPRSKGKYIYPQSWGNNGDEYLTPEAANKLNSPTLIGIRDVLNRLYRADFAAQVSEDNLRFVNDWAKSAREPVDLLPIVARFLESEDSDDAELDSKWTIDVDIVEHGSNSVRDGPPKEPATQFIVCRVGPSAREVVKEGDIIWTDAKEGWLSLVGPFNSDAAFEVQRGEGRETVRARRLRNVQEHQSVRVPDMFRSHLLKPEPDSSKWEQLKSEFENEDKLLEQVAAEFSKWQAGSGSNLAWSFVDVLNEWRRKGLVFREGDRKDFRFVVDKWPRPAARREVVGQKRSLANV
mmetsp:Transcript_5744/g.18450  ORF Transcript_5744/g.18450 Transcript_5744/m.18450 type:complete len:916 (+) Transcript_5744:59-2806(+)